MIIKIPFGDNCVTYTSVRSWDSIPEAQAQIEDKYGKDFFATMCNDNEHLKEVHWEAVAECGFTMQDFMRLYNKGWIYWNDYLAEEPPMLTASYEWDVKKNAEYWSLRVEGLIEIFYTIINYYGAGATLLRQDSVYRFNRQIKTVGKAFMID